jgi:hypothetical protein
MLGELIIYGNIPMNKFIFDGVKNILYNKQQNDFYFLHFRL